MKILVTGGSGFIGTELCVFLSNEGFTVYNFDIRKSDSPTKNVIWEEGDLLDLERLVEVFIKVKPDMVVHLAARTDLEEKRNLDGYLVNTKGVDNLIKAMLSAGTVKRAIITSSQLVCRVGYKPKNDNDYCPNNLYGESKVETEKIVKAKMPNSVIWCLARPTTIWGEGMSLHYQQFLKLIKNGRYFHIGNVDQRKSYGYIKNAVYQYYKLLTVSEGEISKKVFYIADYNPISLRRWVDELACSLGAPKVRSLPMILARCAALTGDFINLIGFKSFPYNTFRLNNVLTDYVFEMENTRMICGDLPYSMKDGVANTANWFRKKRAGKLG